MEERWEVLVVGAGPAGSGAALAAAASGARTLLIDRKKEIGTPVQCGEVVGESLVRQLKLKLPPQSIASIQDHTRFLLDRRLKVVSHEPYWRSVTLERKIFDKLLAARAAEAGASVHADTRLQSVELKDGKIVRATLMHRGEEATIKPKVVIAADGAHSTVAKLMGADLVPEDAMANGIEFEMVAKKRLPSGMQIFLEPEVGLGYGWIIPKGPRRANVGLGVIGLEEGRRSTIIDWVTENPIVAEQFDLDQVLEVKSGDAPLPGFLGGPRKGNVLFAGDAAGQTLAFVGEGILPSYACGQVAGSVAAAAARSKSLAGLDRYDSAVREQMGGELEQGGALKDAILGAWSDDTLSEGHRTVLCGLIMSGLVQPDEMQKARSLLELPTSGLVRILSGELKRHRMNARVSKIKYR